jgi:hypothetical protein
VALRKDGTLVAWGNKLEGESTVPFGLNGLMAFAGGYDQSLAIAQPHPRLGFGPYDSGASFDLNLQGMNCISYRIDASTDLLSWLPMTNFVSTNEVTSFRDSSATNYSRRFYRAVLQ